MNFRLMFRIVLCFGLLLMMVRLSSVANAADLKATNWKMMIDDGNGKPGDEVDSLEPTDHKVHFQVELSGNVAVGDKIKFTYTAVEIDQGKNLKVLDVDVTADKSDHIVSSNVSVQKDWPVGKYKVDLSINGKPAGSFDYDVEQDEGND
jgi:uncharacterized protein involved in high-affinity Fe2+ transport